MNNTSNNIQQPIVELIHRLDLCSYLPLTFQVLEAEDQVFTAWTFLESVYIQTLTRLTMWGWTVTQYVSYFELLPTFFLLETKMQICWMIKCPQKQLEYWSDLLGEVGGFLLSPTFFGLLGPWVKLLLMGWSSEIFHFCFCFLSEDKSNKPNLQTAMGCLLSYLLLTVCKSRVFPNDISHKFQSWNLSLAFNAAHGSGPSPHQLGWPWSLSFAFWG